MACIPVCGASFALLPVQMESDPTPINGQRVERRELQSHFKSEFQHAPKTDLQSYGERTRGNTDR